MSISKTKKKHRSYIIHFYLNNIKIIDIYVNIYIYRYNSKFSKYENIKKHKMNRRNYILGSTISIIKDIKDNYPIIFL